MLAEIGGNEFDIGLRGQHCWLELANGECVELGSVRWHAPLDSADEFLLSRCRGPSLDVGCGPGRLTAALTARGCLALGIDTSTVAVRRTRERGGTAMHRDVFGRVPGEGRWHTVLLADGNIGIGGNPATLLGRIARLTAPHSRVLVELAPPGTGVRISAVRMRGRRAASKWFRWAWLGPDSVSDVASAVGFEPRWVGEINGRWFTELRR